jgi:hypothetical protein
MLVMCTWLQRGVLWGGGGGSLCLRVAKFMYTVKYERIHLKNRTLETYIIWRCPLPPMQNSTRIEIAKKNLCTEMHANYFARKFSANISVIRWKKYQSVHISDKFYFRLSYATVYILMFVFELNDIYTCDSILVNRSFSAICSLWTSPSVCFQIHVSNKNYHSLRKCNWLSWHFPTFIMITILMLLSL